MDSLTVPSAHHYSPWPLLPCNLRVNDKDPPIVQLQGLDAMLESILTICSNIMSICQLMIVEASKKHVKQLNKGEKRVLNSELWHACAGPLVSLPPVGSRVVYFPQGHSEQVSYFVI
ncbi:hypothetical protein SLEP1_g25995 [Rubroshorea leprosula]|uniref:Uncharacterized protein n=1 Tax=Rubroshorea leprosula TaxID=152421 RepID=A0AAV5JRT3_9ROSI|nr:hypothetical protein SLEP1_g25995 [Rubroshorea leprosula]